MTNAWFSFVSNLPCLLQLHRTHINVKSILVLLQSPEVVQEMKMFLKITVDCIPTIWNQRKMVVARIFQMTLGRDGGAV